MQTSTQLTINQRAVSVTKYSWAKEMFVELDNGDSVRVVCTDETFINALNNYINLTPADELDKLPEFSRKCLNNVMTKLYDYFNQDDANS
jgi:hypothetical protein